MSITRGSHTPHSLTVAGQLLPQIPTDPIEFLSRSWTPCTTQLSKALIRPADATIPENAASELEEEPSLTGNPFSFASSETSQLILERILSQSQEISPLTSGRLSHSSGPLNGGSLSDSPPISPSDIEDKLYPLSNTPRAQQWGGGSRTVGRWLKDRREKKNEETRAHNAKLHAAISLAGVAAAVAAIASATAAASSSNKDDRTTKTDMAVAAAATLVASQCVEAADALGAEREHLASVVGSAVNVRSPDDIATLTATAAAALRGAATLNARPLKEVWNIAAVIPVEKGVSVNDHHGHRRRTSGDELAAENFVGLCNQELLARGTELLKRTRKGDLHWKVVSVYIHRTGVVMLKTKSRHVAATFTKKKKIVVTGVCKDIEAWPGRHLLEGSEQWRYFGLRTGVDRRVIEFECRSQREYEVFTMGVSRLLDIVAGRKKHVC